MRSTVSSASVLTLIKCSAKLIMVSGAQGGDVYAGDTEARLRAAFDEAAESLKCSPKRPVMIFIDEIVRPPTPFAQCAVLTCAFTDRM